MWPNTCDYTVTVISFRAGSSYMSLFTTQTWTFSELAHCPECISVAQELLWVALASSLLVTYRLHSLSWSGDCIRNIWLFRWLLHKFLVQLGQVLQFPIHKREGSLPACEVTLYLQQLSSFLPSPFLPQDVPNHPCLAFAAFPQSGLEVLPGWALCVPVASRFLSCILSFSPLLVL